MGLLYEEIAGDTLSLAIFIISFADKRHNLQSYC